MFPKSLDPLSELNRLYFVPLLQLHQIRDPCIAKIETTFLKQLLNEDQNLMLSYEWQIYRMKPRNGKSFLRLGGILRAVKGLAFQQSHLERLPLGQDLPDLYRTGLDISRSFDFSCDRLLGFILLSCLF